MKDAKCCTGSTHHHACACREAHFAELEAEKVANEELMNEAGVLEAENVRLRAIVAADRDDVELIRADAQYLHAGMQRHGMLPPCAPQYAEQILDRALAMQRRYDQAGGGGK